MPRFDYVFLGLGLACVSPEKAQNDRSSPSDATSHSYATDFAQSESPLSEGGRWLTGGTDGKDWTDVSAAQGRAIGHQVAARNTDATAILDGQWRPNQSATAIVVASRRLNDVCRSEVELRLRSSIQPHSNRGYEIAFAVSESQQGYLIINRWNGVLGDATTLFEKYGAKFGVTYGDTVKATIVGTRLTAYKNGLMVARVSDIAIAVGNPGFGFRLENSHAGCPGTNDQYGFTRFKATDIAEP